ncbi:MAG: hypothetical protein IJI57_02895 [Flexilinea sp.]|nr:hypothetical protein [Flexilinea sp.]
MLRRSPHIRTALRCGIEGCPETHGCADLQCRLRGSSKTDQACSVLGPLASMRGRIIMKMLIDLDHMTEPTGQMRIRVSRRGMLAAAADNAEERTRSRSGSPSYHIEDLTAFDEVQFAEIWPIVNSRAKISLEKGVVYAETSASVDPMPLFAVNSPALFIFNQFNSMQKMSDVFVKVRKYTGWDEAKTKKTVRAIFLRLCEVRVCEPGIPD